MVINPIFLGRRDDVSTFLISAFAALLLITLTPVVHAAFADRADRPAAAFELQRRSLMVDALAVEQRLLVAGERGRIFFSDDQGDSWSQAQVPVSVMITALAQAGGDTLWAVGHDGVVLTSADRGESWRKALGGNEINQLVADYYQAQVKQAEADADYPIDLLEELQFRAEDALIALEESSLRTLLDVYFVDAEHGYVLGAYGLLLETRDGGRSWQPLIEALGNLDGFHLNVMTRVGDALLIAGEGGMLFRSLDIGQSWEALLSPYDGSFFGLQTLGDRQVVAYGLRGNAFESLDGGDSWQRLNLPVGRTLAGSAQLSDGSLVLVGSFGSLLQRSEGQQTFIQQRLPKPVPSVAVAVVDDSRLLVASLIGPQIVTLASKQGE